MELASKVGRHSTRELLLTSSSFLGAILAD